MRTGLYAVWKGIHMKCGEVRWNRVKTILVSSLFNVAWVSLLLEWPNDFWPSNFWPIWYWLTRGDSLPGVFQMIVSMSVPAIMAALCSLWIYRKEIMEKRIKAFFLFVLLGIVMFWVVLFVLAYIIFSGFTWAA